MHILILHQHVPENASADEQDVLVQVAAVSAALLDLGHQIDVFPCTLDLELLAGRLNGRRPDVVFNLVESLAGTDSLQCVVPLLVESRGLRMTGSSAAAILNSGRKGFAKQLLCSAGLATPPWFELSDLQNQPPAFRPGRYILKPVLEHASLGMTDADVVSVTTSHELRQQLIRKCSNLGRPCFAEAFIDGREFNLSLLANGGEVQVLPPAEIDFVDFPEGKPRIVGSAAKWDEESFEYGATVRKFGTISRTDPVYGALSSAALTCWQTLGLSGYGRVDFRVDHQDRPWILEANANPCLSPDAGFAAAVEQAGLSYVEVIERILQAAMLPAGSG